MKEFNLYVEYYPCQQEWNQLGGGSILSGPHSKLPVRGKGRFEKRALRLMPTRDRMQVVSQLEQAINQVNLMWLKVSKDGQPTPAAKSRILIGPLDLSEQKFHERLLKIHYIFPNLEFLKEEGSISLEKKEKGTFQE